MRRCCFGPEWWQNILAEAVHGGTQLSHCGCEAERGIDEGVKYQHCFKGPTATYIPSIGTHFQDVLPFSSNYQVASA